MATRAIASPVYQSQYIPSSMSRIRRTSGGSLYGGNAGSLVRDYSTRPPSGYSTTYGASYRDTGHRDTTSYVSTTGRAYGTRIPPTGRSQYESKYGTPRYTTTGTARATSPVGSYSRKQTNVPSRAHTLSPRPLPPGPGPLDENNRRMSVGESMKRLSRADSIPRTGPLRAAHGTSTYGTSSCVTSNAPLSRSRRTSSVTDLTAGINNVNLSSSSLTRSRKFGSQADLSRNKVSTPDKSDRLDGLFDSSSSSNPVSRSYYNTNSHTYDYKSTEHDMLPHIRRRSLSQDPTGNGLDSSISPSSRRTSLVSSRASSIDSPNHTVSITARVVFY